MTNFDLDYAADQGRESGECGRKTKIPVQALPKKLVVKDDVGVEWVLFLERCYPPVFPANVSSSFDLISKKGRAMF